MSSTLIWVLAGTAFLLGEMIFPALVMIFFSFGAWVAALCSLFGEHVRTEILVFIVVSLTALGLLRRYAKNIFSGRTRKACTVAEHPMTGQRAVVSRVLTLGAVGEVCLGGSFWRAVASVPVAVGQPVRVLGTLNNDDLVLRVEPVEM